MYIILVGKFSSVDMSNKHLELYRYLYLIKYPFKNKKWKICNKLNRKMKIHSKNHKQNSFIWHGKQQLVSSYQKFLDLKNSLIIRLLWAIYWNIGVILPYTFSIKTFPQTRTEWTATGYYIEIVLNIKPGLDHHFTENGIFCHIFTQWTPSILCDQCFCPIFS